MIKLDPVALFERISTDIPAHLQQHLFVTGSLAAAYEFRSALSGQAVNTKDADLVVHPASHVATCRAIAQEMLELGWRRHPDCYPRSTSEPANELRAVRLLPPTSDRYFVEFLVVPEEGRSLPSNG